MKNQTSLKLETRTKKGFCVCISSYGYESGNFSLDRRSETAIAFLGYKSKVLIFWKLIEACYTFEFSLRIAIDYAPELR